MSKDFHNPDDQNPDGLILPYALGTLPEDEKITFESQLANDPNLAARVQSARRVLEPLGSWRAPMPPTTLVDNILVQATMTTPLEYVAASASMKPVDSESTYRRPWLGLRELGAVAACIAILVSLYVPGMQSVRSRQLQTLCDKNLASFGSGLRMYATEYDGQLPSIGTRSNVNWLRNDPNRGHLLPAIQGRFVLPKDLICPASDGSIDKEATLKNIQAFLQRSDLSFWSVPNANGPRPRINIRINIPIAVDPNPLFQQGKFQRGKNGTLSPNASTHEGRGQNVLFNDGSTRFLETPLLGKNKDNIWLADDIDEYQGTEAQQSTTDAFLTP
ncbi:MAG: hypothetical protein GXP29_13235 [Planctomycetes bacterium]|nr:hypothetical protein [Planctomycetota bacterium]